MSIKKSQKRVACTDLFAVEVKINEFTVLCIPSDFNFVLLTLFINFKNVFVVEHNSVRSKGL